MRNVFIAGATGWAGSELAKGIVKSENLRLVGALSRSHAGTNLAEFLKVESDFIPVYGNIENALNEIKADVMIDYTNPSVAKHNIITALNKKINVVVGTSGLTEADYLEIEKVALSNNCSVLAVGNFALTMVLLQKFAEMAAKYIPDFEIIDYAHEDKVDAPSGTVRELAYRLTQVRESQIHVPESEFKGLKETRGARMSGVQVHAVRLPGYVISVETLFGLKDERLTIRHDSGSSALPYVKGAILALEKVGSFKGLKRGLDSVMDF
ncbi:4-hydroxy-tetrahydrodipicolinate reductase [Pedobacter sp.]|uniref:4-hydroxy-tetrahydrodipicolinate reductase n=1 Tax=Pedobacter sp. TaxID=1411316 RepID=UPI00396C5D5C